MNFLLPFFLSIHFENLQMSNAKNDANLTTFDALQGGVAVEDEGALGL